MKTGITLLMTFMLTTSVMAAGKTVPYQVNGERFEGYYVDGGAGAPLVLLVHDWDGLTGYEMKRADMLAKEGYSVFAPDLFGAGIRPTEMKDKRQHTGELYKDRNRMRQLMAGGLKAAGDQGADLARAVTMGYCFGGAAVLEFARAGADLRGFVTFHGGLATPEGQDYAKTRGKLMVFHGTADTAITMADFAALAAQLEQQGLPHEMITYGGAPHAFTVFDTDRYRADADAKSWDRFLAFLKEVFPE